MTAGVLLPNGKVYEHSFDAAALAELETFILGHDRTVTLAGVAGGDTDPRAVAIRHDVDHSLTHALRFARWEAERGIRSSYYLLPGTGYWPMPVIAPIETIEMARELQALGHEVGLHNNALTRTNDNPEEAITLLMLQAAEMRSWGLTVTGMADHGGRISGTKLWRDHGRIVAETRLAYEAYQLHGSVNANYVSDNHGRWRAPLAAVAGRQTHVLVHPVHWELP